MSDFLDFASAGLQEAINNFGSAFVWNATTYYGVQSDDAATFDLEAGGFVADGNFSLHCIKSDFDTLPEIGAEITVDSVPYRIARIVTSDADPGVEFVCTGVNK
jgi:hypothetical protein